MSSPLLLVLASVGAAWAWPLTAFACSGAEFTSAAAGDVEVLLAYIDPGVAGFVIVAVLGFISSAGYLARSYIARAKRWLFGHSEPGADADADGEATAAGDCRQRGGELLSVDGGSFKDPSGRVYLLGQDETDGPRVVRGLTAQAATTVKSLLAKPFFSGLLSDGDVVTTRFLCPDDSVGADVVDRGWASAVEHEVIGFLTWPYEWPFSMLKDAALLQLHLLETCVRAGWHTQGRYPVQHSMGGHQAGLHRHSLVRPAGGRRILAGLPTVLLDVSDPADAHGASGHTVPAAAALEPGGNPARRGGEVLLWAAAVQAGCALARLVPGKGRGVDAESRRGGATIRFGAPTVQDSAPGVVGQPAPCGDGTVPSSGAPVGLGALPGDALVRRG